MNKSVVVLRGIFGVLSLACSKTKLGQPLSCCFFEMDEEFSGVIRFERIRGLRTLFFSADN